MGAPHCFATYFMMKYLDKPYIVESGVWRGQSTWLIETTCPNSKLLCIDPNLSMLAYKSAKATYTTQRLEPDLLCRSLKDTLCFFDDHQDAISRIKVASKKGFKHLIFEDNYPTGQGDCASLKQAFDRDDEVAAFLREKIDVYITNSHQYLRRLRQDGETTGMKKDYPTQKPIFSGSNRGMRRYRLFHDDAGGYTWIAYVRLK